MLTPRHPHPPGAPQSPPANAPQSHPPGMHQAPAPGMHHAPPLGTPQPFAPAGAGSANLPRLTEQDQELLKQLLGNDEQAQAVGGMLQNSPPEIAALGYLILRVSERSQS